MRRRLIGTAAALILGATTAETQGLSLYGLPGLVDMPTARAMEDGSLALTAGGFGGTLRNTLAFQVTPRLTGSFRYARIRGYDFDGAQDRFDRSFDLQFQLASERGPGPAVALGLRDFGGTGIYSSEYLVATKTFGSFELTAGLGWGRLAERDPLGAPLGLLSDRLATRPDARAGGIEQTGRLDAGSWFRGNASAFGGLAWEPSERWRIVAEYSPDLYRLETDRGLVDVRSPVNLGASYRWDNGIALGAYAVQSTDLGLRLSYGLHPARPPRPGGAEPAPPPLLPSPAGGPATLMQGLEAQGIGLEAIEIDGALAEVRIENRRWPVTAQAVGRTARALGNTLPEGVERLRIVFTESGMPMSAVSMDRQAFAEMEFSPEGGARLREHVALDDAWREFDAEPRFTYGLGPYAALSTFDPDAPLRADVGLQLDAAHRLGSGLSVAGRLRQPLAGSLDESDRVSDSRLPHVRSDSARYDRSAGLELTRLTADYLYRPGPDLFGRVSAGYLERMFGGLSAELLWYPVEGPLALGAEVNYARQRGFDLGTGFRDYDVWTGHASAYYDLGLGYRAQLDAGRYLAGDWGATLSLDRDFGNGFSVGAFLTLTDVAPEDFGEGSFDKGIRLEIPVSWITGVPTRSRIRQTIRPVLRDGGARLNLGNRLYEITRPVRGRALTEGWGRAYR
ncbi:YjbH domain-containing protein [Histidinibacterium aquaticum]|uniref:YjbH domain-containing protein n=1 Tax=Histidinibacterium aquaticum TaxID=2613962 RepID=UPI001CC3E83C|nr:YjbH domain-containing protein [Histidinibacterium aquaticum]